MKKVYIAPETEVVEINCATSMLCSSILMDKTEDPADESYEAL